MRAVLISSPPRPRRTSTHLVNSNQSGFCTITTGAALSQARRVRAGQRRTFWQPVARIVGRGETGFQMNRKACGYADRHNFVSRAIQSNDHTIAATPCAHVTRSHKCTASASPGPAETGGKILDNVRDNRATHMPTKNGGWSIHSWFT
jgi:hypothetical protein